MRDCIKRTPKGCITRDEESAIILCDSALEAVVEAGKKHGREAEETLQAVAVYRITVGAHYSTLRAAIVRLQGDR